MTLSFLLAPPTSCLSSLISSGNTLPHLILTSLTLCLSQCLVTSMLPREPLLAHLTLLLSWVLTTHVPTAKAPACSCPPVHPPPWLWRHRQHRLHHQRQLSHSHST